MTHDFSPPRVSIPGHLFGWPGMYFVYWPARFTLHFPER